MINSAAELRALQRVADLEPPLTAVENGLMGLRGALCQHDPALIEQEAAVLHRALATAIEQFSRAARDGGVPSQLRHRLALVSGQVAAQREALARATASLDRAIDVLLPEPGAAPVYGRHGGAERPLRGGPLQA
jgi:hypothetical protein